jgi:dTDP-4-dehydrorhamnose 3,5-epimerase
MQRLPTRLDGPILIAPKVHPDERGFFCETFRRDAYEELGIPEEMLQDNHSRSSRGVVRGLHFQVGRGTSKLVRCARGEIFDVAVDLRRGSPTFGHWEGVHLSEQNMHVFYCPVGFAHGFCVLSDLADVIYQQSNYYSGEIERGIAYDDPQIGIRWPLAAEDLIVSERDANAPRLSEIADSLRFEFALVERL